MMETIQMEKDEHLTAQPLYQAGHAQEVMLLNLISAQQHVEMVLK